MRNPYRARVDERHFLNLPGFHGGAYVRAYVEDTSGCPIKRDRGSGRPYNTDPRLILEMADCERRIALEFELYNSVRRMNSFHKIDTLIAALVAFRDGMAAEAELYRARDAEIVAEIEAAPPGAYANDDEDDDRDDHELDRDEEDAAAMNE
jgi:hypothetical protein